MNLNANKLVRAVGRGVASVSAAVILISHSVFGQTIQNPSFEANSFSVSPGYISDNAAITGWTASSDTSAGLNPAGGDSTFADNGAVPNGTNVAFLQNGGTTLSTVIAGLTVGQTYNVAFRVNTGTNQAPILRVSIDGSELLAANIYPVEGANPYKYVAFDFTATAASQTLTLMNESNTEVLLVDDFAITAGGSWNVEAWTGDADSGVDPSYVYTHAYSFGGGIDALINNVLFTAVPGVNPAVVDKFSTLLFGDTTGDPGNNLTGASADLGRNFVYQGGTITSGNYQTITLKGLTPGTEYVATLYSVAWEATDPTRRWATLAVGNARLTVNQDQFEDNNGIRFSCRYTADATGMAEIKIAQMNPVNVSIHCYGFSNREAVSRNVKPTISIQPRSSTVSSGIPVKFTVAAAGFPAPTYKWRFNGNDLVGANTDTYTIAQAASQNAGNYDVVSANSMGSVTSVVAKLIVGIPMTNPSFEADAFLSWPGYSGSNPGDANTPPGENGPITGWTLSSLEGAGLNPISNGSSPFADNGVVPNGTNVAFIQADRTLSQTAGGLTVGNQYYLHYYENGRSGGTSIPALEAKLGTEIVVPAHLVQIVGGANSYHEIFSDVFTAAAASVDLAFIKSNPQGGDSTVLIDNVAFVPVAAGTALFVTRNPQSQIVSVGDTVSFSGQAIGSLPITFQWLKNGTPVSQATSPVLTLTSVQKTAEADYALVFNNSSGSVTSAVVHLTVFEPISDLFNTGVDDNRVALADGLADPHYEMVENADTNSTYAIVEDSTAFPITAGPWLLDTATSKWIGPQFNTTASLVGTYTYRMVIDLTDRDPQTVVILGRWASDNTGSAIRVNGVSTGNASSPGFGAWTPFSIYGTNTSFVAGSNILDFVVLNQTDPGYTGLRVEFLQSNVTIPAGVAPEVTTQPLSQTVAEGDTVTFTATAKGASPLTYQWKKNGSAIAGQTTLSLTLPNVTSADAGAYTITVANSAGTATSLPAQLVVAYRVIPVVYGSGVGTNGNLLAGGSVDPHYILAESADTESPGPDAIVVNDGWPIEAGVWMLNGPSSKWIAPKANQSQTGGSAPGDYTYQTTFNLTGYDLTKLKLVGGWASDNLGSDILVNGASTGITNSGFGSLSLFTITNGLIAGVNTVDFKVRNDGEAVGPTALRVDLRALLEIPQVTRPTLQATLTGTNISVSWSPVSAGQKLQMASEANGSWQDIPNATNPFTTNTSAARLFFRVAQ